MESIIASLISAIASVIVAVISKSTASPEKTSTPIQSRVDRSPASSYSGKKQWRISLALLVPWLLLSPPLIQWDLAGINLYLILAVTLAISFVWPIKPLPAAAIVLILHPLSFAMEPIAKGLRGMNPHGRIDSSKVIFLVTVFLGNAVVAGILCAWRGKAKVTATQMSIPAGPVAEKPRAVDSLSQELDKLGSLRAQGILSEEEFQKAKAKVLGN